MVRPMSWKIHCEYHLGLLQSFDLAVYRNMPPACWDVLVVTLRKKKTKPSTLAREPSNSILYPLSLVCLGLGHEQVH
jgi:hypothetical protein